jgi:hypothetical protein
MVLLTHAVWVPWTDLKLGLPPLLAWSSGLLSFGLALFSYAVALGGMLALHNDAKGRAYF